jgi:hypothetical protein
MSAEKVIVIALQIALFASILALGFKATLASTNRNEGNQR